MNIEKQKNNRTNIFLYLFSFLIICLILLGSCSFRFANPFIDADLINNVNDDEPQNSYKPEIELHQDEVNITCNSCVYDFGGIFVDETEDEIIFTINNIGNDTLIFNGSPYVEIKGIDADQFTVTQQIYDSALSGSESTNFKIVFAPTSEGEKTATVSIDNNDSDEDPFEFSVTGYALVWKQISSDPGFVRQIVSIDDTLFSSTGNFLYKIDFVDLGSSWTQIRYDADPILEIDADLSNIYYVENVANCVYYSDDEGDSWSYIAAEGGGTSDPKSVDFHNGVGWCARDTYSKECGAYRKTNNDSLFYQKTPDYTYNLTQIVTDIEDPTNCAYAYGPGYSVKTTDGGATWTSISEYQEVYYSDLSDDDYVIYSDSKFSSNNGSTWIDLGITANAPGIFDYKTKPFARDQVTDKLFIAKDDGNKGVYVKDGASWIQYGTELNNIEILDLNICDTGTDYYLFAVTSTGQIYYSLIK